MSLFWLRRPHVPLFWLLLAAVAFYPAVEDSPPGRLLLNLIVIAGVVISLARVHASRRWRGVAAICGVFGPDTRTTPRGSSSPTGSTPRSRTGSTATWAGSARC